MIGGVGHIDEVDLLGGEQLGNDARHVIPGQAAGEELVAAHPDSHADLRADGITEGLQHLDRKPEPVGLAPSVAVVTPVRYGREELLEEVAVAEVDLEAVEAGFHDVAGRRDEAVDELRDVGFVHHVGHRCRDRPRNRRWPPRRGSLGVSVDLPAEVDQLAEHRRPVGVDGICDGTKRLDRSRVVARNTLWLAETRAMHPDRLEDDEPGATFRSGLVIVAMAGCRQVVVAEVRRMGRDEDAVL